MPKPAFAESLLALFAGRDRAAAILGDLLEMKATRGSLWFWTAYTRTLISLGWRTPVAFVIAIASMGVYRVIIPLVFETTHRHTHLRDAGIFGVYNPHTRIFIWNLSLMMAQFLIFALPFVAIRFGLRNRLTQLTGVLFLIAMPVYTLRPWLMDLSDLLTLVVIAIALILPSWRRPMIVMAVTFATAFVTMTSHLYLFVRLFFQHRFLPMSNFRVALQDDLGLALAVIVFLYLHRKLLRQRPVIA